MNECRFDNWTRMLGALRDRRAAFKELTAAGVALVSLARVDLGLAQEDDVAVEGCRLTNERCKRNNNCCSGKCHRKRHKKKKHKDNNDGGHNNRRHNKRKGEGQCECLGNGKSCSKDAACCKGHCDSNERKCRCVPANDRCNTDNDCCSNRKCVSDGGGSFKVCKHR
jgi:hypothetical protein